MCDSKSESDLIYQNPFERLGKAERAAQAMGLSNEGLIYAWNQLQHPSLLPPDWLDTLETELRRRGLSQVSAYQ